MKKYNYIYTVTSMLYFILIAVMNIAIAETINMGDIKFKKSSSSGTVSGTVIRVETHEYGLIAGPGQWMEVKIKSPEDNAVFQLSVLSPAVDLPLDGDQEGDGDTYFYGRLPKPGYSKDGKQNAVNIIVGGTRGNASYEMTVKITNKRDKVASANHKYAGLLQTLACYTDEGQYGKTHDLGYRKSGEYCGYTTTQAGYWVWKNPYWYVWERKAKKGK